MSGVNHCVFIGHLGRDAELRYTTKGDPVCNFSMAINETWNNADGEKQERVEWVNIVIYGKIAEALQPYLVKGKQVYAEGRLATRQWEDKKTGEKRRASDIVSTKIVLLGGGDPTRQPVESRYEEAASARAGRPLKAVPPPADPEITDDDIPF